MKSTILACALSLGVFSPVAALAADVPGSQDYPLIKRYEGSEIIGYTSSPFDSYNLSLDGSVENSKLKNFQTIEGAITRYVYRIPASPARHSSLEIFRNYEQALTDAKFQILYESPTVMPNNGFATALCNQSGGSRDTPFGPGDVNERYLAAKLSGVNNKDVYVALLVGEVSQDMQWVDPWRNPDVTDTKPVLKKRGEVIVVLDVAETKAMENKMVFVKSSEMADAINKTGKIDIYGITFDVDKTDIKPESVPTLAEVAKLLQENPTLKLEISGHTDNTGNPAHNQTLSEGRAAAVVNALVSQYHVDASRLVAKGYGDTKPVADNATEDGRAKNRRVELSKLQ